MTHDPKSKLFGNTYLSGNTDLRNKILKNKQISLKSSLSFVGFTTGFRIPVHRKLYQFSSAGSYGISAIIKRNKFPI